MKSKKGSSSILLLFFAIVVLLGAVAFWLYVQNYSKSNKEITSKNKNASQVEDKIDNDEEDYSGLEDLLTQSFSNKNYLEESNGYANLWNGKYVDNTTGNKITIYRDGNNTISMDISAESSYKGFGNIEIDSADKIEYEDEDFGENISLNIERNANDELIVKAFSDDEESACNFIDGTYVKEDAEDNGWSGKYSDDENAIILAQVDEKLYIIINEYWQRNADEFDDEKLTYEDEFFEDQEKLVIEKTTTGIKITEASSTDEEDILNEINGKELKKVD